MPTCDAVVIGLGVIGSAAAASLARRRCRTIGIERFGPGHDRGSSHGATRIIRQGYFEHPSYVPLVRDAYPRWHELAAEAGEPLIEITGILEIGAPGSALVTGTLAASRLHGLAYDVLDTSALRCRFPQFQLPDHYVGVFQPDGGFLRVEPAMRALLTRARAAGAALHIDETVHAVEALGEGVRVVTTHGTIDAGCAVVAAGPWVKALLPDMPVAIRVTRQVLGWFAPGNPILFAKDRFPVFLLQNADGLFYGFPDDGTGSVKVAKHGHADATVDPDRYDRVVSAADEAMIRSCLAAHLPAANGPLVATTTCLYTMAPDGDFILDRMPGRDAVIVASTCSGHGFKFAPVIGEIIADLATSGTTAHDISRFGIGRFSGEMKS
ncbi:MAG: N-methyl-L-tryptophan oxidase [Xanthobacteraceae bacterium]|nr:N-methyl-L-tryptophan oxidase [Xanthobacteraceae bacterium]